jgi:hypothetical protein
MKYAGLALLTVIIPVHALGAELAGKLGYLSEWEVTAHVHKQADNQFSGPVTVRHVGVCAPGRPVEMTGRITYTLTGWAARRMEATLVIDGTECGFQGKLSEAYDGVLTCQLWRGVPLSISVKSAD